MLEQTKGIIQPSVAGLTFTSSGDILGPQTRIAQLIWGASGQGKTHFAGTLDAFTQKIRGKRTVYIPVEAGEGGGAATIRNLDIPMIVPRDYSDMYRIIGLLRNDKSIGGVVFDSASEFAQVHVKTAALKYPSKENSPTRASGVPVRGDYQVMGELMAQTLRLLIGLTTHENPDYRKDLIVTATDVTREEDDKVTFVGPNLPGRMAKDAVAMFQQVGMIYVKPAQVDGKRVLQRHITFAADGVKALKDRYKIYPESMQLRGEVGTPGEDVLSIFEKYWEPAIKKG